MFRFILTIASMGVAVALALAWTLLMPAHAHDYKRPDLDGWYSTLHRKGLTLGCCSKEDCHTTEAEVRNGVWWARMGGRLSGRMVSAAIGYCSIGSAYRMN